MGVSNKLLWLSKLDPLMRYHLENVDDLMAPEGK